MRDQNTPTLNYSRLKSLCKHKGQPIEISFEEWWSVWEESGKWELRGRGKDDYCLGRLDPSKPFTKDNVSIRTLSDNLRFSQVGKAKSEATKDKMSEAHLGVAKSEDHKLSMSEAGKRAWAEGKHPPKLLLTCPSCGRSSKQRHKMNKNHFDNCPYKGL